MNVHTSRSNMPFTVVAADVSADVYAVWKAESTNTSGRVGNMDSTIKAQHSLTLAAHNLAKMTMAERRELASLKMQYPHIEDTLEVLLYKGPFACFGKSWVRMSLMLHREDAVMYYRKPGSARPIKTYRLMQLLEIDSNPFHRSIILKFQGESTWFHFRAQSDKSFRKWLRTLLEYLPDHGPYLTYKRDEAEDTSLAKFQERVLYMTRERSHNVYGQVDSSTNVAALRRGMLQAKAKRRVMKGETPGEEEDEEDIFDGENDELFEEMMAGMHIMGTAAESLAGNVTARLMTGAKLGEQMGEEVLQGAQEASQFAARTLQGAFSHAPSRTMYQGYSSALFGTSDAEHQRPPQT
eukprot:TRINITY_DN15039_c0_g1_i1.p1 TRINITY_DN15039_c0_g1~~TRINITY_DN15039_c0_g1_i1.p1  ORF type:complete len:352 (-),score=83.97 TRINITY_DN15039_c0_g1_i1:116-1171(-)